MTKYLAIDFETANEHKLSACSIGVVQFDKNEIIKQFSAFIKPPTGYQRLNQLNYKIHGINQSKYMDSDYFDKIWEKLQKEFDLKQNIIVCHNASFDINVLKELFKHYKIKGEKFYFLDTINLSKLTWNLSNYKLSTIASNLNIQLNHHNALSDSLACASIAMRCLKKHNINDFNYLLKDSRFGYGKLDNCKTITMSSSKYKSINNIDRSFSKIKIEDFKDIPENQKELQLDKISLAREEKVKEYEYVENLVGFIVGIFSILIILQTLT